MSFDTHKNFAYSTVATAPSPASSGTSLVVVSGDGSKFATAMNCVVWPTGVAPVAGNIEIIRITAISTDTLTITRATESSSARSIVVGDQIAACLTIKSLTDIEAMFPVSVANGGTGVTVAGATLQANPANPTAWGTGTSSSFLMLGLNQTITPVKTGTLALLFGLNGNGRGVQVQLQYGTGSAPSNQAALTGTTIGAPQTVGTNSGNSSLRLGPSAYPLIGLVTGLTLNTAYWFDVAAKAAGASSFAINGAQISIFEL